ncbi:WhiB family transcriptional regulator [Kitasatospora sp. NPDC101176]|uniref:WhiB family transcriptional regulator n=1 Tax=Kitasatospora sp. NPDC101176 TaxID=3364099 RepID=UPI003816DF0E
MTQCTTPNFVPPTERWGLLPCADPTIDPDEVFFGEGPDKPGGAKRAVEVCSACPVRSDCLMYARTHAEWGVWGGESETDRARRSAPGTSPRRRQNVRAQATLLTSGRGGRRKAY